MLIASGATGMEPIEQGDNAARVEFVQALTDLMQELAQAVVRDGEGATKFITITVEQANSEAEALAVAYTVAHSPLVKTACFASDPNWGRILAAVGRAPVEQLDVSRVSISLDDVRVLSEGGLDDSYAEVAGQAVMDREEFTIRIGLGQGQYSATVWTTDLSHEYIRINAEYRT
jgi:glutamate N-acetyltransferase/amino-acid N-acetyltransferase